MDAVLTAASAFHEDRSEPPMFSSGSVQRDGPALVSPTMSRPDSVASGRSSIMSTMTTSVPSYVGTTRPSPEYISAASAGYLATESQSHSRGSVSEDDDENADQNGRVVVGEGAVSLINAFLDKLLFDFLSVSRSTNLVALKSAITDVLRRSLARDAIARAQDDVEDLLALQDSDDEEEQVSPNLAQQKWNIEFAWKRIRLRVMMRSENSEFDIDDDEKYVQEEALLQGRQFSQASFMSLSAEIFLAGVLEFVAEQLLSLASAGATTRARRQGFSVKPHPGLTTVPHVLIQEPDVEKAALNSSMERLWRSWRKSLRSRGLGHHHLSTRSLNGSPTFTQAGNVLLEESHITSQIPDMEHPEHVIASNIPLPMNDRDIDEINTPWLAKDPDEGTDSALVAERQSWHHPVSRVSSLSYFSPLGPKPGLQGRPATSHHPTSTPIFNAPDAWQGRSASPPSLVHPIPTPLVDAPGAWPLETPLEKNVDDTVSNEAKSPSHELIPNVESLRNDPAPAPSARTRVRTSPIPTLEPSQVYADSTNDLESPQPEINPTTTEPVGARMAPLVSSSQSEIGEAPGAANGDVNIAAAAAFAAAMGGSGLVSEKDSRSNSTGGLTSNVTHDKSSRIKHAAPLDVKMKEPILTKASSSEKERYTTTGPQHTSKATITSTTPVAYGRVVVQPISKTEPESVAVAPALGAEVSGSSSTAGHVPFVVQAPPHTQQVLPLNSEQRSPKQIVRSRYSQDHRPNHVPQVVISPADFLASRNLSPPSSPSNLPPVRSQQTQPVSGSKNGSSIKQAEKVGINASSLPAAKEAPRAIQGLGISRQPSEDFKTGSKLQGLPQHSVSKDIANERQSRPKDSDLASTQSWCDTNRSFTNDNTDVMDDVASKSSLTKARSAPTSSTLDTDDAASKASLTKLTSASIASPMDFDTMVQSNDTIKYTLTPERAREPSSIATASPVKAVARSSPRRAGSKDSSRRTGSKDSSSSNTVVARQALPSIDTDVVGPRPSRVDPSSAVTSSPATASLPKDIQRLGAPLSRKMSASSRPAPKNAKPTSRGHVAREPQVQTSSTLDFADFIRTTGPENGQSVPPRLDARSVASLRSMAASSSNTHLAGNGTTALGDAKDASATPSLQAGISSKGHSNLQARGAQHSPQAGNSADLIDFLRSGPPDRSSNRMSRTVSPYRNTMDSDATPTSITSISPSVRSSVNSQVRLIPSSSANTVHTATTQPSYTAQSNRQATVSVGAPAATVERTRHRNKDPYYIEDSEDEDLLTALPKDRRAEESLMDFLRNNEPPMTNAPKPLAVEGETQARAMLDRARANSVSNLRAATAGTKLPPITTSVSTQPSAVTPKSPISPFPSIPSPRIASTSYSGLSHSSQPRGSYTTISSPQNKTPRSVQSTTRFVSPGGVPRNPNRVKLQVRDAGNTARTGTYDRTGTGDLADFLRNSGPPSPFTPRSVNTDGAPASVLGRSGGNLDKKASMKFWKKKTEA